MKTKQCLIALLALVLFVNTSAFPVVAEEHIRVLLNGKELSFDVAPQVIDGRTLVPIRAVCEQLGADVYWLEQAQLILVVKNDIKLALAVGKNQMFKVTAENFSEYLEKAEDETYQSEEIYLDVPPQIIGDRTLLPIRAVCEALGAQVSWNDETNTIAITCSQEMINDNNRDVTFFDDLMAYLETRIKEQRGEYSDFDYSVNIKLRCSSNAQESVAVEEYIKAKIDVADIELYTIERPEENLLSITFGYDKGFDIDGFVDYLENDSSLSIVDADQNVILEKNDIVDAKTRWLDFEQSYGVVLFLTVEGQEKLAAATEFMIGKKATVCLGNSTITTLSVEQKIDSDNIVIGGSFDFKKANSLVYLIKVKEVPNFQLSSTTIIEYPSFRFS